MEAFSPYPKNPLLASFFVNIGRADTLGSGMRNLYKYTKLYSHAEPILTEGDVFKTGFHLSVTLILSPMALIMALIIWMRIRICLKDFLLL